MEITTNSPIIIFLCAFFGGGGIGWVLVKLYMQKQAKEAVKEDLNELGKKITALQQEVNSTMQKISENYVSCKYCSMQHDNLNTLVKNIDHKIDILIEDKIKKSRL